MSLAIEAWPLLERLLERALRAAVQLSEQRGQAPDGPGAKHHTRLLAGMNTGAPLRSCRMVGSPTRTKHHVATFEAKYARSDSDRWPPREHYFQALATAAACGSDLAVLVYPDSFDPFWWTTTSFNGHAGPPGRRLASSLFSYRRGPGTSNGDKHCLDLLDGPQAQESSGPPWPHERVV